MARLWQTSATLMLRSLSTLVFGCLLAACGEDEASGALGQASARAACADSDVTCSSALGLRAPLATGQSLPVSVSLSLQGGGSPPLTLTSADPSVFSVDGTRLLGVRPGVAALLITTSDQRVVDFVHVWVADPTSLVVMRHTHDGVEQAPVPASMQLAVGDDLNLSVVPYAADRRLAGEVQGTWETSDDAVVQLLDAALPTQHRVRARAPGKATLSVRTEHASQSVEVSVLP